MSTWPKLVFKTLQIEQLNLDILLYASHETSDS